MRIIKRTTVPAPIHVIPSDHIFIELRDDINKCRYEYCHKLKPQIWDTVLFVKLSKQELGLKTAETVILGESNG